MPCCQYQLLPSLGDNTFRFIAYFSRPQLCPVVFGLSLKRAAFLQSNTAAYHYYWSLCFHVFSNPVVTELVTGFKNSKANIWQMFSPLQAPWQPASAEFTLWIPHWTSLVTFSPCPHWWVSVFTKVVGSSTSRPFTALPSTCPTFKRKTLFYFLYLLLSAQK